MRIWSLPQSHTTYAPCDRSRAIGELIGYTNAVWDFALVRGGNKLISCGAKGTVNVWEITMTSGNLKLPWTYHGLNDNGEEIKVEGGPEGAPGATAVEAVKMDLKKVAVARPSEYLASKPEDVKLQPEIVSGRCFEKLADWRCTQVPD